MIKFIIKTNRFHHHWETVLESVSINLEADIAMVDKRETALAKIGKLSEIALALNQVKSPKACERFVLLHKQTGYLGINQAISRNF